MKLQLENLKQTIINAINEANSLENLENIHNEYFSKRGALSQMMANLRNLEPAERPAFGKLVNTVKDEVRLLLIIKRRTWNN